MSEQLKFSKKPDLNLFNKSYGRTITLDWGMMDALQHVNNAKYLRFFENARMEYFRALGMSLKPEGVGPILGSIACRYRRPLIYPDTIDCLSRVTAIHDDRFFMEQAVYSHTQQNIVAYGPAEIIAYDYNKLVKSTVPKKWSDLIKTIDKYIL